MPVLKSSEQRKPPLRLFAAAGCAKADGYVRLVQGRTANSTILQIDHDGRLGSVVFRR
ncbi:MAG: hypothetical protein V7L29_11060 [Nostoc sp.]|uniref:hypothetical protein n=1 Tax=Nostoc sp. TaxID=1180 RepID=UPI002FEF197D